jgi:hypothetical protein
MMPSRSRWLRAVLFGLAAAALLVSAAAFFVALRSVADAHARLDREVAARCVTDAQRADRQRALDLGLIAADEAEIRALSAERAKVARLRVPPWVLTEVSTEITADTTRVAVRRADVPAYVPPASCNV